MVTMRYTDNDGTETKIIQSHFLFDEKNSKQGDVENLFAASSFKHSVGYSDINRKYKDFVYGRC